VRSGPAPSVLYMVTDPQTNTQTEPITIHCAAAGTQYKNWFTEFSAYRKENKANLPLPLDVEKLFSFRGLCPQTPIIGSRSHARHSTSVSIIPDLPLHHCLNTLFVSSSSLLPGGTVAVPPCTIML